MSTIHMYVCADLECVPLCYSSSTELILSWSCQRASIELLGISSRQFRLATWFSTYPNLRRGWFAFMFVYGYALSVVLFRDNDDIMAIVLRVKTSRSRGSPLHTVAVSFFIVVIIYDGYALRSSSSSYVGRNCESGRTSPAIHISF